MFHAFVNNSGDFSLLQSAVTFQSSAGIQTVEAGWINYPRKSIIPPHWILFSSVFVESGRLGAVSRDFKVSLLFSLWSYLLRCKAPLQFKNYIPTESMIEQVLQPHIFTFFTTDGYTGGGTKIGGYNQDVGGWVQTDSTYFPGSAFSSISTFGGTQYDMTMQYQLYQGNWWLYVIDR